MYIEIANKKYRVVDNVEKITIADSFVVPQNKLGDGHGEKKLYIGSNLSDINPFYGKRGFEITCFLLKKDLINHLDETKYEYYYPEQSYRNRDNLANLWKERKKIVENLPDVLEFKVTDQDQVTGPRVYVKSQDDAYQLIRELSLPNITYLSIIKLQDNRGRLKYYLRLFADFFGETQHPQIIQKVQDDIEAKVINVTERLQLQKARIGQGEFRTKLLTECQFCPITMVSDDRLLIASHIKPWTISNNQEKLDPKNGLILTPTFDKLFDLGFLSFTNDKKTILSPFLSKTTYDRIGINDNRLIPYLQINGREDYLDYHRTCILKR